MSVLEHPAHHRDRRGWIVLVLASLLASVLTGAPSNAARSVPGDATYILKTGADRPTNTEVAVRLSLATPGAADRVVIGRDDVFADSLSSALLQDAGPLLLVPPEGPVPQAVVEEISRVGASQAVLLGGENALASAVADELTALGLAVTRREGPTRLETAIAVAETHAPAATTALLVRAFPSAGAADSQAFADSLGAGAVAAENGWPILLTQTEVLSDSTRDYLASAAITDVRIVGGTAAISADVEAELQGMGMTTERVAGADRFETAVALARESGSDSAADVARVILVSGEGDDAWAAGFASARHAAVTGGAIVLARDPADLPPQPAGVAGATAMPLPEATEQFLAPAAFAGLTDAVDLTCVAREPFCEQARQSLGRPASPIISFTPADRVLDPGEAPTIQAGGAVQIEVQPQTGSPLDPDLIRVASPCTSSASGQLVLAVDVERLLPPGCQVSVHTFLADGTEHIAVADFNVRSAPLADPGPVLVSARSDGSANGTAFAITELHIASDGSCVGFQAEGEIGGEEGRPDIGDVFIVDLLDLTGGGSTVLNTDTPTQRLDVTSLEGIDATCTAALVFGNFNTVPATQTVTGLFVVDIEDPTTYQLVSVDDMGDPIASGAWSFSDDGSWVAYAGADNRLYRHEVDPEEVSSVPFSSVVTTVTGQIVGIQHTAISDDSERTAVDLSIGSDRTVGVYGWDSAAFTPADRGPAGQQLPFAGTPFNLDISRDGSQVVFDTDDPGRQGRTIYVTPITFTTATPWRLGSRSVAGGGVLGAQHPDLNGDGTAWVYTRPAAATPEQWVSGAGSQAGCAVIAVNAATGVQVRMDSFDVAFQAACGAPAAIADDGTVVHITTAPLVPEDTNGGPDVYVEQSPALFVSAEVTPS